MNRFLSTVPNFNLMVGVIIIHLGVTLPIAYYQTNQLV